jgi:MFS family permease
VSDPSSKRKLPILGGSPKTTPAAGDAPKPKKRLPVLQNEDEDDEAQDRPPWHWSAIGMIATFLAWLPLASIANALVARMLRSVDPAEDAALAAAAPAKVRAIMIGVNALCFALAALAGGYLVGRFGGRAGRREATLSGLLAAVLAWGIAMAQSPVIEIVVWSLLLVVIGAIGAGAAYLGGRVGLRRRQPTLRDP